MTSGATNKIIRIPTNQKFQRELTQCGGEILVRAKCKHFPDELCHISMTYASYDIKCYIMTNDAYDIEI